MVNSVANWKNVLVVTICVSRRVLAMMETLALLILGLANYTEGLASLKVEMRDFLVMLAAEANWVLAASVRRLLEVRVTCACQVWLHNQKALLIDD